MRGNTQTHLGGIMARVARYGACSLLIVAAACGGSSGDGITVSGTIQGLRFVSQPGTLAVGQTFSASVELIKSNGDRATASTDLVTLSLGGGGTLTGTTTATAVAGLASFSGLAVTAPSTTLKLTATGAGFTTTGSTFVATDPCAPVTMTFPGSTSGTLVSGGCRVGGSPGAFYRFTAPAGLAAFTVTSPFGAEMGVMNDPPGDFVTYSPAPSPHTQLFLLPSGSYQFRMFSPSGTVGAYTLAGSTTAPAGTTDCTPRGLLAFASAVYTGTLNVASDCVLQSDGTAYDRFFLYSSKPCKISLHMNAASEAPFLFVLDGSTGATIATNGSNVAGSTATVDLSASSCSAGANPLEIQANKFAATTDGYTLTITVTGAPALVAGDPAPAQLALPVASALNASSEARPARGKK